MEVLGNIALLILSSFLSLTNGMAEFITETFELPLTPTEHLEVQENALAKLPSRLENALPIPDILLKNAAYQEASLIDSFEKPGATAKDPRDALVNIFCTFTTPRFVRTTTGTGFFVHPDGVVLTNAHVAQFLLLEHTNEAGKVECVLRTGNPAEPRYEAELLYIPPAWIQEYADQINETTPVGTGERDYALLYVTAGTNDRPMPQVFPALQVDSALLPISVTGATVNAAGYPAGNFLHDGASMALIPERATTTISELYTFGSNYADVFSIRGSAIGQQGSSGGPVLSENGQVIGMITTRGNDETEGPGSLRAITISHINRTILEETGFNLERNLTGNLPFRAKVFNDTLRPFLSLILSREAAQ